MMKNFEKEEVNKMAEDKGSSYFGTAVAFFLLGATVGAAIALLLTPWTGQEIRSKLPLETAEKKLEKLRDQIANVEESRYSEESKESTTEQKES